MEVLPTFTQIHSIQNLILIPITIMMMMKINFLLNTWSNECNKITEYLVPVTDKNTLFINYPKALIKITISFEETKK